MQLVGCRQGLSSIRYFLADAGTLRLGDIHCGFDVASSAGRVSVNLHCFAVGKNDLVESYIRNPRTR